MYYASSPTETDVISVMDVTFELTSGKPFFLMLDFTNVESFAPAARRAVAEGAKKLHIRGIAICGANFHMKVMTKLVNSAIGLFRKLPFPQDFFDTREAALAWLDELRKRGATGGDA